MVTTNHLLLSALFALCSNGHLSISGIVACVQVVWLKGLEQVQAVVDLLAAGLLAGLESRGEEPDAAFRAAFRLACVAAVDIERTW